MGGCVSSDATTATVMGAPESAAVLILCHENYSCNNAEATAAAGTEYVKFAERMTVAEVAKEYATTSQCFICSCESVQVGHRLTELRPWQYLELGEIYFLLPRRKLMFQITEQDMSFLVLKAAASLRSLPLSLLSSCNHGYENDSSFGSETGGMGLSKLRKRRDSVFRRRKGYVRHQRVPSLETIMEVEVA